MSTPTVEDHLGKLVAFLESRPDVLAAYREHDRAMDEDKP